MIFFFKMRIHTDLAFEWRVKGKETRIFARFLSLIKFFFFFPICGKDVTHSVIIQQMDGSMDGLVSPVCQHLKPAEGPEPYILFLGGKKTPNEKVNCIFREPIQGKKQITPDPFYLHPCRFK